MESFSQRYGYRLTKSIQYESVDQDLRTALWNVLSSLFWSNVEVTQHSGIIGSGGYIKRGPFSSMLIALWVDYFKKTKDTFPDKWSAVHEILKKFFFNCEWFEVFDFLEIMHILATVTPEGEANVFQRYCNESLSKECSAYQFLDGKIVPMTNHLELDEVERAIESAPRTARQHLETAVQMFSQRTNPDYRNSIKESISAVEAVAKSIVGTKNGTLPDALELLGRSANLHPALRQGLEKIYGYSSDANGIRHALMEESNLTASDARFMLVICSAFVNYLESRTQ